MRKMSTVFNMWMGTVAKILDEEYSVYDMDELEGDYDWEADFWDDRSAWEAVVNWYLNS